MHACTEKGHIFIRVIQILILKLSNASTLDEVYTIRARTSLARNLINYRVLCVAQEHQACETILPIYSSSFHRFKLICRQSMFIRAFDQTVVRQSTNQIPKILLSSLVLNAFRTTISIDFILHIKGRQTIAPSCKCECSFSRAANRTQNPLLAAKSNFSFRFFFLVRHFDRHSRISQIIITLPQCSAVSESRVTDQIAAVINRCESDTD